MTDYAQYYETCVKVNQLVRDDDGNLCRQQVWIKAETIYNCESIEENLKCNPPRVRVTTPDHCKIIIEGDKETLVHNAAVRMFTNSLHEEEGILSPIDRSPFIDHTATIPDFGEILGDWGWEI